MAQSSTSSAVELLLELRRDRILHPPEAVRLEALADPGGLDRRQAVVDVVQEVQLGPELGADALEESRDVVDVGLGAPDVLRGQAFLGGLVRHVPF